MSIQQLKIHNCPNIHYYPQPLGSNQRWKFDTYCCNFGLNGYGILLSLDLSHSPQVTDLSMLGNVKYLRVSSCFNVKRFPIPIKNDQEWSFEDCKISDLTGYSKLHSLKLKNCGMVVDVSPLCDIHTLELINCKNITNIDMLTKVKILTIENCSNIKDVGMLRDVEELHFK